VYRRIAGEVPIARVDELAVLKAIEERVVNSKDNDR